MKRILSIFLASLLLVSNASMVFAANVDDVAEDNLHTITLQRTKPIREGDDFAWTLVAEPGELAMGMNALGLGNQNSDIFGEDTTIIFAPERVDLEEICTKYDVVAPFMDNMPITITYSSEDIDYSNETNNETSNETQIIEDDISISPRTTGSFNYTIEPNDSVETSKQTKDDNDQDWYLTLTKLAPSAYQYYDGVNVKVKNVEDSNNVYSASAWYNFTKTDEYILGYYSFFTESAGDHYRLLLAVSNNNKDTDVKGKWTP